ncbi:MAG: alpha/beta hydrolase domain-containing protein [Bryobacteraceae bacterium]
MRFSLLLLPLLAGALSAAIHTVEIVERTDVENGKTFGKAGAYERLAMRARFRLDPRLPANRLIADLRHAPVNEHGMVEFTADAYVLKPRDPSLGNGTALFEVSNRGGRGLLSTFANSKGKDDPGDGLLFEQGYTLVWVAWQFDVPERKGLLTLQAPPALGVTGMVRSEAVITDRTGTIQVADRGHVPYAAADRNEPAAKLLVRQFADSPRTEIPRKQWRFTAGDTVALDGGFQPGKRYEVIYTAKDPAVAGVGFAAVRDFISFLKYGGGLPTAVLGEQSRHIKRSIGWGSSQSGRFLREFLYQGFNADENGRRVFDGLMPHIAGGGRGSFHHRFAQPSRLGPWYTTDIFPFRDLTDTDAVTGRTDGLLRIATGTATVPKIFFTNTSNEYWRLSASLTHTSLDGASDAPLAPTTRIYYLTGTQHGAGSWPPSKPNDLLYASNPNNYRPILRALLTAMNEWVTNGTEPPPSQYPANTPDQLAEPENVRFPKLPGFVSPNRVWHAQRLDFGPHYWMDGIISFEPAKVVGAPFPIKVPQVDVDGNEVAGIRNPVHAVPLGTYAGWNIRRDAPESGREIAGLTGSYLPFPATRAEREHTGDPRASIEERYASRAEYLDRVTGAARKLAAGRYLLEADVAEIRDRAAAEWDTLTGAKH